MARKQVLKKNLYIRRATPDPPSHLDNLWLISEGSQRNFRISRSVNFGVAKHYDVSASSAPTSGEAFLCVGA
jgi:hypothetical protein